MLEFCMAKISKLKQVAALHSAASERLIILRTQIAAVEIEERKLGIALEVLRTLDGDFSDEDDDEKNFVVPKVAINHQRVIASASVHSGQKSQSVRGMIIAAFKAGEAKNSMDVYKALRASGHEPNANTINSTLSKMVKDGLLIKASQSSYLLKVESPTA